MTKKTKKKTAKPSSKKPQKKRISSAEMTGVLLALIAVFILISLVSYDSLDPSWATGSSPGQKIHNFGGRVGASLSEALFQLLGLSSFFLPFVLFFISIQMFLPRESKRVLLKTSSIILLLINLSAFLSVITSSVNWRGTEMFTGGWIGSSISSFLIDYFNHAGSLLILLGLFLVLLVFSTRLSFGKILAALSRLFKFAFKEVRIRITRYQKKKKRKRMRERVIKKYSPPKKKEKEKKGVKKKPVLVKPKPPAAAEKFLFPEMLKRGDYMFPPLNLLEPGREVEKINKDELFEKKQTIEEKLLEFKVEGEVLEYHPGPILTTYEFFPNPGIKVSQVANLTEDLSLALRAEAVRIQRIPGKSSLGIEAPNNRQEIIRIRDIIQSEKFVKSPSKLSVALGKTIHGEVYITDLSVMPHLLIAGATGTGKSVALNAIIASILYKATPDEVKLILIDPKRLEFSVYEGVPHLLCPVVKNPKKAESILLDAIQKMEVRYHMLGKLGVRNIEQYNQRVNKILKERKGKLTEEERQDLKPLPYIVIIIDELAELMMIGAQEVEYCIARLAQLARAVGIHLVLATQRPSTDVITGTIKNNFSSRISFRVPSKVDSRIIIDASGAEQLLGRGDMLFMPPNYPRLLRLHCSFITLSELTQLVKFVKEQRKPEYDEKIIRVLKSPAGHVDEEASEKDPLYDKAVELVLLTGQASASYLQRKLKLGYARASRIIDQMEQEGVVGPSEGSKPREILIDREAYMRQMDGEE
ncbi:MAG: DNA translocase FtsK 4TM domain-containing protein [Candidatus Aminicenantes bacterium]|jgi:S-DNA-T family DNA segregation ATPase FtsK/SpoIIIE